MSWTYAELDRVHRQAYLDLCAEHGIDMPCRQYDSAGEGAGLEADGKPQCASCGHPELVHDETITEREALVEILTILSGNSGDYIYDAPTRNAIMHQYQLLGWLGESYTGAAPEAIDYDREHSAIMNILETLSDDGGEWECGESRGFDDPALNAAFGPFIKLGWINEDGTDTELLPPFNEKGPGDRWAPGEVVDIAAADAMLLEKLMCGDTDSK